MRCQIWVFIWWVWKVWGLVVYVAAWCHFVRGGDNYFTVELSKEDTCRRGRRDRYRIKYDGLTSVMTSVVNPCACINRQRRRRVDHSMSPKKSNGYCVPDAHKSVIQIV
jgi:hypothetical protein